MNQGNGGKEIFPRAREFKLKKGDYMKKQLKKVLVFALALVFLSGVFYSQSITTGAIEGKVTDSEGIPIPGAEVKISSPNMIGGTRSIVTDANGKFRVVLLQPGTYSIGVSLTGFTPQKTEDIRLFVGKTLTIDFALEIGRLEEEVTVIAIAPLIDVKDSGMLTSNMDEALIRNVVFSRSYYPYSMAGLAAGSTGTSTFGGTSRSGNAVQFDGVEASMQASGADWNIPDHHVIAEAQLMGLGANAEYDGFDGGILNMITKSGGNSFNGMAEYIHTDFDWFNKNIDFTKPEFILYTAPRRTRYQSGRFGMGGPIFKDKLWFYGSYRMIKVETIQFGAMQNTVHDEPKIFLKLTYQPFSSTRFTGFYSYDGFDYERRNLSIFRPAEATNYEYNPGWVYNFSGFHAFSAKTFMELKFSAMLMRTEIGGYGGGYPGTEVAAYYDDVTGMYSQNTRGYTYRKGYRWQVNSHLSHHADNFIKGSHDFKFGVEFERLGLRRTTFNNGGYFYVTNAYSWADNEFHTYAYEAYRYNHPIGTRVSVFAQDSWKIADNLTINPGIRYNNYRGYLTTLDATLFKANALAPRIGLAWDVFGDHKTVLKAHYGRYIDKFVLNDFSGASGAQGDSVMWEVMPDGTKVERERTTYSNPTEIDSKLKYPCLDQFTLGGERELWQNATFGVTLVYKKWSNFLSKVNIGRTYELVPFTFEDENGVEHTMEAWSRTSLPAADTYLITNEKAGLGYYIRDRKREYFGFIVEFDKKFSNRWMLNVSYTLHKTSTQTTDLNSYINSIPGYFIHYFKGYGTFILPLDINLSPTFSWMTGARWERTVKAPVVGTPSIMIEEQGTNRYDSEINVDIRFEKIFKIKGDWKIALTGDIYNLFNLGRVTRIEKRLESANFGLATRFNSSRLFTVGVRVYF